MAESPDHDKLTAFFRELTPAARARLARAMSGEAGNAVPYRALILDPLLAAQRSLGEIPAAPPVEELLLAPVEPFVSDATPRFKTRGVIGQATRVRMPAWLANVGAPDIVGELAGQLETSPGPAAQSKLVEAAQDKLAARLTDLLGGADPAKVRNRIAAQLAGENAAADLDDVAAVLRCRGLLAKFAAETHAPGASIDETLRAIATRLEPVAARHAEALPFALVLVRRSLPNPQSFVRLAAIAAETTDAARICGTPYIGILDLALAEVERELGCARASSAQTDRTVLLRAVRAFGAATRALSTEVDLPADGPHARRLGSLRSEMAEDVRRDLQDLPPRIRRLVRPRSQERMLEDYEINRLLADLDLLLIARSYAEEIALNALSGRVFSEVRELLDTGTQQLIERLRNADETAKADVRTRLSKVVDASAKIFGSQYATLISKAIDVAGQEARRTQLRTA